MDCSSCGARTPEGAKFCTWCGAGLEGGGTPVTPRGPWSGRDSQAPEPEEAGSAPEVFVGRASEWATLLQILARSQAGRPQFVLISGDPGIGKSALAYRFMDHARSEGARVVSARPGPPGRDGGGDLVRRLLLEFFAADPTWSPSELRAHLASAAGDDGERVPELLGHLLGLAPRDPDLAALGPRSLRQTAWEALSGWLARQAADRPLVIGLSALHRADEGSLEWLDALCWHLGHTTGARVLVVGQFRAGALDPLPGIDSPMDLTNIALRPLPEADARALAETLAGPGKASLAARAVARAEGNPFFLTQLLLAAGTRSGTPLPETIRAAVLARLESLDPRRRDVLDVAAVTGRTFEAALVAEVAGRDVAGDIQELVAGRFLRVRSDGQVEFSQGVVQEIAQEAVDSGRRTDLHRKVGLALERRAMARAAAPLAYHFAQAADAGRAARYSWLAGCQARSAYAVSEAGQHFEGALDWLDKAPAGVPGLPERAEILLAQAGIARALGDYGRSLVCLDERANLAPETAASLRARGEALYRKGELKIAQVCFERAGALADAEPAEAALARAGVANILRLKGDLKAAAGVADEARATLERLGRSADAAFASSVAGICLFRAGRYPEALAVHEGALRLREAAGDLEGVARSHSNLGITQAAMGDREAAHAHHTRALAMFRRLADRRSISQALTNLGDLMMLDSDAPPERLELAARHFEEALKIARALEDTDTAIADLGSLAELAVRRGNAPYALAAVDECLELMGSSGHGEHGAAIHATRARAFQLAGDAPGARSALATARDLAAATGNAALAERLDRELAALAAGT